MGMPGMRNKFAKDPDYSGAFYVESFQELFDADFLQGLNNYLCLVENRCMCRVVHDAYVPPASGAPTQAEPTEGFRGLEEDYQAPTEAALATSADATTEESTTESGDATTPGAVTTP